MAEKRGRKSKYDEFVAPHLNEIKNAVEAGATDAEIAESIGISVSTLIEYKKKYPEFQKSFARGREKVVFEIKAALLKKALGFNYEEEKRTGRKDKSGENIILVEKFTRYCPPSETAAGMLLRNYDRNWLDSDRTSVDLRIQEHDLRAAIAAANNFDLNLNELLNNMLTFFFLQLAVGSYLCFVFP